MATTGREVIRTAFDELKAHLSSDDVHDFTRTELKDVRNCALDIERQHDQRLSVRNMRRIEPILVTLEEYAGTIEIFCQGFPPMALVWGPMKFFLQVARNYNNVMEKILEAYKDIASVLPRLDTLRTAFPDSDILSKVLGEMYKGILEFHGMAYRFFKNRFWHVWFAVDWGLFERRFKSILRRLESHSNSVDKEAAAIHFLEMQKFREGERKRQEDDESQRRRQMYQELMSSLAADEELELQEQHLERLDDIRQQDTCNWILSHHNFRPWLAGQHSHPLLWLTGIPGAGKSVSSSFIIRHLRTLDDRTVAYYFFRVQDPGKGLCIQVLRTICVQMLDQNPDLSQRIHLQRLQKGPIRRLGTMRKVFRDILLGLNVSKPAYLVLDGIDECEKKLQDEILKTLLEIQKEAPDTCHVLFSSREEPLINENLKLSTHIALRDRHDEPLKLYVQKTAEELKEKFPDISAGFIRSSHRKTAL